jgi:hypothetical protein
MDQSTELKPQPPAPTLGGMTARWSDPHRLAGSLACRDLGYVRAVKPREGSMIDVGLVLAFLSGVVTGVPTSVRAKGFRSKPDDNKGDPASGGRGPPTLTAPVHTRSWEDDACTGGTRLVSRDDRRVQSGSA